MAIMDRSEWQVEIKDVDVSGDVESIESISSSLDTPELTEYTVSELTFSLRNRNYDYSPDKPSNFFSANGLSPNGFRAPIVIKAGLTEIGKS